MPEVLTMADLIDRDALGVSLFPLKDKDAADIYKIIMEQPTIEPKHGTWNPVRYKSHCNCDKAQHTFDVIRYECSECKKTCEHQAYGLRYCPYCGSDNGDAVKRREGNG